MRGRPTRPGRHVRRAYALPVGVLLALTLPHLGQGDYRSDTARCAADADGPPREGGGDE
jgi:hypothetical protein